MKYRTPRALEQAVKAAAKRSGRDANKAIKGFYHDRLLCRVFSLEEPAFVLKGGQSMLAKIRDARETKDIDLLGRTLDLDEALEELKAAAAIDLGDYLEYRFHDARPADTSQDYREGYTARFDVWLGGTKRIETVSVDLVVDPIAPSETESLTPVGRLDVEGLLVFDYIANTAETRVAEKVCATMQTYATGPSSRVKDLVDLVTSMLNEEVDAGKLSARIAIERRFRHIEPFAEFAIPESWETIWAKNYQKLAHEAKLPERLEDVMAAKTDVATWLNPVFAEEAIGLRWDPISGAWR